MGTAAAQEGHPMVGSWSGEWSPTAKDQVPVLFVMEWKGRALVGIMNPGLDDEAPAKGELDSSKWVVRLEAETKDERGMPVKVVFDGKLENIGSYNRTLTGVMTRGGRKGRLTLTRE
jgi:hypothetical protein